jgi:hypothetical protein
MTRPLAPVLRPLPRTVKPFPGETIASYLARLAHANRLDTDALCCHITGHRRRTLPFPAGRLAVVAGFPVRSLQYALPDLATGQAPLGHRNRAGLWLPQRRQDDGPPCRLCVLARGITQPVHCWKRPENVICQRHRRWIGPGAAASQPDLSAQPDILQAHKRHLRLVRRLGRDTVAFEFAAADHICRHWHTHRQHDTDFQDRMLISHGPRWQVPSASPTVAAAIYPQAVALTRLLASPYWRAMSSPARPDWQELFIAEIRRTAAPGYHWPQQPRPADPLHAWITERNLPGSYHPALFRYHTWPVPSPVSE